MQFFLPLPQNNKPYVPPKIKATEVLAILLPNLQEEQHRRDISGPTPDSNIHVQVHDLALFCHSPKLHVVGKKICEKLERQCSGMVKHLASKVTMPGRW